MSSVVFPVGVPKTWEMQRRAIGRNGKRNYDDD